MSEEKKPKTTKELLLYLLRRIIERKRWFLLPLWLLLAVLGVLLILTGNTYILPVIYIAF
jgi:hypothetical protein